MDTKEDERIVYVISKLSSSNPEKVLSGLIEIRTRIIKSREGIEKFLERGGIEPVIKQLTKTNQKIMDVSLSILGNLAVEPQVRSMVKNTSLVSHLAQIAKSIRNESILCRAYRTIGNLAEDKDLCSAFFEYKTSKIIMEAIIGGVLMHEDLPFSSTRRRTEEDCLKLACRVNAADIQSLKNNEDENKEQTGKLKNEETIQMAVRALRELGHTKSQRRTTFHEGLLLVLTEALKSESPAILKIALKTYSHYFSENCNIEEWVQAAKDKLHSSRLDCQDQLSNSYLSVLHCGDYGASRILELCESDDLKVRDTATFLLCKLSGKDFFRCKFRAGGVSILMTKIDIYPKNSRIWKNLVHALAFYTRNNVISQTDQNMLIVLYNAMTDLTLSDEFRNFILNAFLQLQFSEDSLNTLYKLGLHNSLLQIIENYAIENEFDGCFTVKPKSEVTETVAEESESGEEYDSDLSKKKKQFSISSPSFLAIEEEVRSRREKSPGVYNVFGIPVSPSHEVAPDGSSSPTGYISRPGCSYYSPPSSPCSSLPLSPSCDVFQSYDYASEPESKEESSVVDREVERKRIKRDESILNLDKLIRQSQESLKSSKITVDDSISAPLDWSLSLLNNIHWRVGKTDLKNDLKALKVLTTYIDAVKQPSLRCCSVLRRITSKTSRLSQIISEGFVTHLGKLKFQCNCDRHSNRNQIAEEALKSISAAAATPYGFHQMKSLLESDFSNVAVSLPYLKIDDREMLYLFDQTFPKLINIKDNTSVISAIREYGRRFFPVHDSIVKAKKKAHLSCCVDETNVYFVTDSGEKIGAKREQINSKFEAMLKFHATSEIPWKDTDARLVKYLVHYVSGCRKTIHKCCALKGLKLTDKGKLLHLGRSYFVDDLVSDIMFDLVSSEVTSENVAELYVNIFSCDIGDFESEKVIFLRKIVDSNDLDLMRTMLNSNLSEHFLGVICDAVHERFERFIGK